MITNDGNAIPDAFGVNYLLLTTYHKGFMDWSLIILGTGAEGTENLLKILGNQVLYALRFWEPSIILRQFFMT